MTKYSSIETDSNEPAETSLLRMLIIGLIVVSPSFLTGMSISYTTIALPQMSLSLDDATWFGAVGGIVSPIGTLLVGFIIVRFGRKAALLFSIIPSVLGWFFLFWFNSVPSMLFGQLLHGLTPGAAGYPSQVYVGECVMMSSVRLRNSFMMWIGLVLSLGMTVLFILATFLDYRQVCGVAAIISVILFLIFYFVIPESPLWLYRRGRISDAKNAEKKLGISQPILLKEEMSETMPLIETSSSFSWTTLKDELKKIKRRDVYKPLIISTILSTAIPLGGPYPIMVYMISILKNETPGMPTNTSMSLPHSELNTNLFHQFNDGNNYKNIDTSPLIHINLKKLSSVSDTVQPNNSWDPNKCSVVSGVLMMIATLLAAFVLPYIGFKKCLIFTDLGISIGMVLLAYTDVNRMNPDLPFLRIVSVWLIIFLSGIVTSASLSFAGDLFPPDAKGYASISITVAGIVSFFVIKLYPYMYIAYGWYVYYVYALVGVFSIVFVYFFVPEVAGKTLEEINNKFLC